MKVVCLSDTHDRHADLTVPDGDLLVHAGDFTGHGERDAIERFDAWLGTLPHAEKIVIAGNHDFLFERSPREARALITNAVYLEDEAHTTTSGLRVWGSPWQPWFFDWAFNLRRGAPLKAKWDLIPEGTDLLVTHGPPMGIGDEIVSRILRNKEHVGCADLLEAVERLKPRLHVFGHIHEGHGVTVRGATTFVNASSCDRAYRPVNPPIVVDL